MVYLKNVIAKSKNSMKYLLVSLIFCNISAKI